MWWLGKIGASTTEEGVYLVRVLDDPGPVKLPLPLARYTTSTGAVRGSWCLQVHEASVFSRGIQRNVDHSRGAAVVSLLSRRRRARQFSGFLGSSPWGVSGNFCVLGSGIFSLGCSWCFLRLEIWIFLLGLLLVFSEFHGQGLGRFLLDWAVWLLRFFVCLFLVLPTPPRSVMGSGWSLSFVCLLLFFPSCRPPPLSAGPWSG